MSLVNVDIKETRDQFLQLLVTQLRHQDPLEPIKQQDVLGQLAQFSTVEGIEKLNENFEGLLQSQENAAYIRDLSQSANLLGKTVIYGDDENPGMTRQGTVDAVEIENKQVLLRVGAERVPVDALMGLKTSAHAYQNP